MAGTLVFIPAWNEENSLPGVLEEGHAAPEVEALVRITDAKLRLMEVPVHMRQREHGQSSFRGGEPSSSS